MAQRPKSRKSAATAKSRPAPARKSTAAKKSASRKSAAPAKTASAKKTAKPAAAKSGAAAERKPKASRPQLPRWMADHLERYLRTNGADGHIWHGMPTLLLTCTGRSSGEERTLPLLYGRDGDRYLVVASRGGSADHPGWYKNLVANPEVKVQVAGDRFRARARTANHDERPRLWRMMAKMFPNYDIYQSRTSREIPIILLERH
jgi:deazaflavin-dependent oxidoreductase (nitroreductase family)